MWDAFRWYSQVVIFCSKTFNRIQVLLSHCTYIRPFLAGLLVTCSTVQPLGGRSRLYAARTTRPKLKECLETSPPSSETCRKISIRLSLPPPSARCTGTNIPSAKGEPVGTNITAFELSTASNRTQKSPVRVVSSSIRGWPLTEGGHWPTMLYLCMVKCGRPATIHTSQK